MSKIPSFITFEGGEGSGKSTLIARLAEVLTGEGYQTISTREPGGTALGEKIRELLLNKSTISIVPQAESLLFLTSRVAQIEEVIKPALAQGKIVLCDRFNDSTIAYQGVARGLGFDKIEKLTRLVCEGCVPDLTFFLDVDPLIGLKRAQKARDQDRMESEALLFHQKVREGYHQIARKEKARFQVIDASQSKEEVFKEVYERIKCFPTS